ncbi:hypothetical protein [Motiliproteus sp. MSK22-1]|nr:hypothetical protein [Motiliproteus sp. MSK22-1]
MKTPHNLKKKNGLLALVLGGFALLVLVTSFPFWQEVLVAAANK